MSLTVQLTTKSPQILLGQDPVWHLTLTNTGRDSLEIIHPGCGEGMTSIRVLSLLTGEETFVRAEPDPDDILEEVSLKPAESLETNISFAKRYTFTFPGEYAVSAVYYYNEDRDMAESDPVRINVRHYTVSRLTLAAVQSPAVDAVYINPAADPAELHLAQFRIQAGQGLESLRVVTQIDLSKRPVVSIPPYGQWARSYWFAWKETGRIKYARLDAKNNLLEKSPRQPENFHDIAAPICVEQPAGEQPLETGNILLLLNSDKSDTFLIQPMQAAVSEEQVNITPGLVKEIPVPMPRWIRNLFLSDGGKLAIFFSYKGNTLNLCLASWPGSPSHFPKFKSLMVSEDELLASESILGYEDMIYGAHLAWSDMGGERTLDLVIWQYDIKKDQFRQQRDILPWSALTHVGQAKIRIRTDGVPVVLIRPDEYNWTVWDSRNKSMKPLPPAYKQTKRSVEIVFLNQEEIMLITAEPGGGFGIKRMDGSDLPELFF